MTGFRGSLLIDFFKRADCPGIAPGLSLSGLLRVLHQFAPETGPGLVRTASYMANPLIIRLQLIQNLVNTRLLKEI
jgi:hypothetical protein